MGEHVVFVEMSMSGAGERALAYARDRGYSVTLVTRTPFGAVAEAARDAQVAGCETNDRDSLLETLRSLHERQPVDGVTTTHDLFVPQAALAAAALGLPGMAYEAAAGVRNKHRMRLSLARACPDLNPPFRLVHDEREALRAAADWGYPVVAKPLDANDSWNVRRLGSDAEVTSYMRATASWAWDGAGQALSDGVLLEGYVDGAEHSVETAQHAGGELQVLAVTGKELAGVEQGCFAEIGDWLPLTGAEAERLSDAVSRALHALGVDCGVIHTECRMRDGAVTILEVNPRLAGDLLGSHQIEMSLGASPIEQVVEIALGHHSPWRPTRQTGTANYGICMPVTGAFGGVTNLGALAADPSVAFVRTMVQVGTRCRQPPESNGDIVARVITRGDTAVQAAEAARRVAARAEVRVL
jgi:biotin carboxylase